MGFDCCDRRGPKTRTITVRGKEVGIQGLDNIYSEVRNRNFKFRAEIKKELLKMVKEKNYVPPGVEEDYARVLLEEYERRERGEALNG